MSTLPRRLAAEGVGTGMLVAAVVGSGIMAQRLTDDVAVQLLANSIATGAALVAIILSLGWVSGAHLNPVVTLAEVLRGGLCRPEGAAYATVQVIGACLGCVVANVMFDLPAVEVSTHQRTGGHLLFSEVVATFGLLVVIIGVARSARPHLVAFAVGGYITAAYWFTSSTSFANPAVTIGRMLTDTFAGIAPASVPPFVVAQLVGGLLALGFASLAFRSPPATELLVPHLDTDPTPEGP